MTRQIIAIGCLVASLCAQAATIAREIDITAASPPRTEYTMTDRLIVRLKSGGNAIAATSTAQSASAVKSPAEHSTAARATSNHYAEQRVKVTARLQSLTSETLTPLRTMGDGAHVIQLNRRMPMHEVSAIAQRIAADPEVLDVHPDRLFFPQATPTDPQYVNQWNLTQANGINMPGAWDITTGSSSLVIAILDTGMLPHNDLAGRWIGGYDFVSLAERENDTVMQPGRDSNPADPGDWVTAAESASGPLMGCPVTDSRWHGTAMAGIIAANANNATGIAGINWNSKILPVRVVGKCGGYESDIIDGMRWAVGISVPDVLDNPNKAKILNVSLAAIGSCSTVFQSAIDDVTNKGVAIIAAAGNNGALASNYSPGNCNGVITVGAVDKNGGLPSYANTGAVIGVSAPGGIGTGSTAVLTTLDSGTTGSANDSSLVERTGTSISAAHATGVASLMLTVNPTLLPAQVKYFLKYAARSFPDAVALGSTTNCNQSLCGGGILNAQAALVPARWFLGNVPQVVAHFTSTALSSDGRVFELGGTPVEHTDINGVARIAVGFGHSVALRTDGTVWAWGSNGNGQLGDGTTTYSVTAIAVSGLSGVTAIAAGDVHSLALRIDGTVWAWGSNGNGQLGDGTTTSRSTPVPVTGLTNVAAIAAGRYHSVALKVDGTVWAWGINSSGELGDGTPTQRMTPVQMTGLTNVTAIAACASCTLALKSDGTVWSTGYNGLGQLGDGTTASRSIPGLVTDLVNVTAIGVGTHHAMAVKSDGTVWAWGFNQSGQVGDGTTTNRLTPVQVPGLVNVAAVSGGTTQSFAIKTDGSVYGWGNNVNGSLPVVVLGVGGAGSLNLNALASSFTPRVDMPPGSNLQSNTIIVSGITNGSAISVTGGDYRINAGAFTTNAGSINDGQSLTLRQTASANCGTTTVTTVTIAGVARNFSVTTIGCGATFSGALATQGNVPLSSVRTSNTITVSGINGSTSISVTGGNYSIGCTASFANTSGTISNNQSVCVRQTASPNPDIVTTAMLTIGGFSVPFRVITAVAPTFTASPQVVANLTSMALRSDGRVFEWTASANSVVQRTDISGVVRIANGGSHMLVLRADGNVWTWGNNSYGQLGDGTTTGSATAIPVPSLSGVAAIAAGAGHALVAKVDGTVWAWGWNGNGQLGNGTNTLRLTPVQVASLAGVIRVASYAGGYHSLALKSDGTVWAWGYNGQGQLGNGTTTDRTVPVQVSGLNDVTAIAAGLYFSLALKRDGTVWGWGRNGADGYLGDNSTTDRLTPVQVSGLTDVTVIAASNSHSLALKGDGTVWSWGFNADGGLGNGTTVQRLSPVQVMGLGDAAAMGAGYTYSLVLKTDGSVHAWGNGALGAFTTQSPLPIVVLGVGGAGTLNLDLSGSSFTPQTAVAPASVLQSNTIIINGIANATTLSVTGGEYKIDAGAFSSVANTINSGQSLTLRQTASANCGTTTGVTVTIADIPRSFRVTTIACGPAVVGLPALATQGSVPLSSVRISNTISVSGISASVPISVTGGEYSISCTASFTNTAGTIANNQTVCVRQTASAIADTVATATLAVGAFSALFRVITAASPTFTASPQVLADVTSTALRSDGRVFEWGANGTPVLRTDISGVRQIAGGSGHTLTLRADGTVWAWGSNSNGQLGDGTTTASTTAIPVPGLNGVAAITTGRIHSLAAKIDGTVWAWGNNTYGQLGEGTATQHLTPVQVPGLTGVIRVAASGNGDNSLALKSDGTVWAWGWNGRGQLGDGTTTFRVTPVQVTGLTNVAAIAVVGDYASLALKSDGTVWSWGGNITGQLGDGTTTDRLTPVQVTGLTNVTAIAPGKYHVLALKSDGTVWAWGHNYFGQLGDGTTTGRSTPVQVTGLTNVMAVAGGNGYSFAIKADGSVYAWGNGALGAGTNSSLSPIIVLGVGGGTLDLIVDGIIPNAFLFLPSYGAALSSVVQSNTITVSGLGATIASPITVTAGEISINGGAYSSASSTVVNGNTVRVRLTTASSFESLGSATVTIGGAIGMSSTFYVYTRRDPARPPATPAASLGDSHSILLNAKGNVFGFGYNGNGQLGNGTTFSTPTPTAVAGVAGILQIASGANHVLALTTDGTIRAWGYNAFGQLGDGSGSSISVNAVTVAGLTFVKGIAAGRNHSLALKADGSVWAWGLNVEGQVGDGSLVSTRPTPVQIPGLTNVIAIAAGDRHSLALLSTGQIMAWGANDSGQLGDGTTTLRRVPTTIPTFTGIVSIAAGGSHSLAIKNDGTAWAWGANGFGQLGIGSTSNSASPVQITSLGIGVGLIAAGENHSLAVKSGGALFSWGSNLTGQLGDGASISRNTPFAVTAPTNVVAISAGSRHSAAINNLGKLFVWGDNVFGQIGNKSGNFNLQSGAANVLQGASQISTYAQAAGSSTGTTSSSGSAVIEIAEIATGYDFKTLTTGTSGAALGKFKNQALTDDITNIGLSVTGPGFSLQSTDCPSMPPTLSAGTECNFTIGFMPAVAGDAVGELQVASNLIGAPERRSLFGTGLPPASPGLKVAATAGETYLSFAPQNVGVPSAASNIVITNTGSAPLIVSSAAVTTGSSHFSVTAACTTTIAAGASCTLPVTFTPAQASAIDGQLTITTNAPTGGTQIVTLSGTGVGGGGGGSGLTLTGAQSRKVHGAAGVFNLTIDTNKSIAQAVSVEPRSIGAGHVMVFQFNQPITQAGTATAIDTLGMSVGNIASVSAQGTDVLVTLTGVPDRQRVTVTLSGVNGVVGSYPVSVGFLLGDVTGNGAVNAGDIAATKARVGQTVGANTYRYDLNGNGVINSQDVSMVKARAGVVLP